jgi:hypothetical protein
VFIVFLHRYFIHKVETGRIQEDITRIGIFLIGTLRLIFDLRMAHFWVKMSHVFSLIFIGEILKSVTLCDLSKGTNVP